MGQLSRGARAAGLRRSARARLRDRGDTSMIVSTASGEGVVGNSIACPSGLISSTIHSNGRGRGGGGGSSRVGPTHQRLEGGIRSCAPAARRALGRRWRPSAARAARSEDCASWSATGAAHGGRDRDRTDSATRVLLISRLVRTCVCHEARADSLQRRREDPWQGGQRSADAGLGCHVCG